MSDTFAGSDAFTATITSPTTGDAANGDEIRDADLALANRTMWLKNRAVDSLRLIEHVRTNSASLALLRDLKTSTSYLDITGVTASLAASILADDVVIVECLSHVKLMCDVSPTDRVEMALALNGSEVAFQVLSTEGATFLPCRMRLAYQASGTVATPVWQLRGKCSTAAGLPQAEVYGPYDLTVTHLRPVAAP